MTDSPVGSASELLDNHFLLNAGTYERDFLPVYRQMGFTPSRLIQFPVILPFHIPLRDGTCVSFELSEGGACTLAFGSITSVQHVYAGIVSDKSVEVPQHRSRVELIHASSAEDAGPPNAEALSDVFDLLVAKLNAVVAAYLISSKDHRVYRVSREMFEFGSIFRSVIPGKWSEEERGLFLLHMNVPFETPVMTDEKQQEVVWYASVIERGLNPFVLVEELTLAARRELLGGGYREAVVFAQTAVETMLSTLLARAMSAEGKSSQEIEQFLDETGFATRLRKQYHTRFGGAWSADKRGTPVGDWYSATYLLRNRVVHAGYAPSHSEAVAALDAAVGMISFAVSRVLASKRKYPSLQAYFKKSPP